MQKQKIKADKSESKLKQHKKDFEIINLEIAELKKSIENTNQQILSCEESIENLKQLHEEQCKILEEKKVC